MIKRYCFRFIGFIYVIIGFSNNLTFAQEANKVISPPPTAAGLGKYGDIPISLYTGIPNINIPLWEISGKQINLPISLSYHASGIKVEENASWVGLGWSLNAGGVITRSVRGLSDEDIGGYLNTPEFPSDPAMENFFSHVMEGMVDTEPDVFFYNFNGKAGKFLIAKDKEIYTIPHSGLDIKVETGVRRIDKITIKDDNGTQYVFGLNAAEETISKTYFYDLSISAENYKRDSRRNAITSWYLKEIVSVSGNEVITLQYADEHYSYTSARKGKSSYRKNGNIVSRMVTQSESEIYGKRLTSINYALDEKSIEKIEFKADKDREDLKQISPEKKPKTLTGITIINSDNNPVRRFNFNTDYFTTVTGFAAPTDHYLYKRLKLSSLTELSGDSTQVKPPYIFTYDDTELPPKDATTQDHWGFYNGKNSLANDGFHSPYNMVSGFEGPVENSKEHLVFHKKDGNCEPIYVPLESVAYIKLSGDNREPSFPVMQAGILKKIQYPTGGSSAFEYEPNDYGYIGDKKETKATYFKIYPSANHERPWDNKDSSGALLSTKNDIARSNNIVIKPDDADRGTNYKTVRIEYLVEYAYESKERYEGGYAYTFNEVSLFKAGMEKPLLKVFYSYGKIYLQRFDPAISPETSLETLTPDLLDTRDYTLSPGPEGYATVEVRGYVNLRLDTGTTYFLESQRYYPENTYQRQFGYVNNTAALIAFVTPISGGDPVIKASFMAGGLRIKRTDDKFDAVQPALTKNYNYTLRDDKNILRSSGDLISLPQHITGKYYFSSWVTTGSMQDRCGWKDNYLSYLVLEINSEFTVPLGSTQGSHLGYRQVQVNQEGNGHTIYNYTSAVEAPDSYPSQFSWTWGDDYVGSDNITDEIAQYIFPFIPAESNDWKRGLLLQTANYNKDGMKISEEFNSYNFKPVKSLPGMVVFFSAFQQRWLYPDKWAEYTKYNLPISAVLLESKEVITYKEGFNPISIKSNFSYGPNHLNPVRSASTTVLGNERVKTLVTYTTYPKDYHSGTPFIDDMVNANLVSVPIEKVVCQNIELRDKPEENSKTVISGEITTYHPDGKGLKCEVWVLETAQPIALSNFKFSNHSLSTTEPRLEEQLIFEKDGRYERKATFEWDQPSGNIKQINKANDIPVSFKWNEDHSLPIAEVKNANASQIFYTSFETDGVVSSQAKTGRRIYSGSYNLILPAQHGKYLLTYWQKPVSSQTWKFITEMVEITAGSASSKSIGAAGKDLDELRFYPVQALMTSYTYDPLIGMTSATDANNVSTFYVYDDFGRLTLIKDESGKILKKFDYKYAGQ